MNILGRAAALEAGLPRYFTGKPCKNGHVAERFARNSDCIACSEARTKAWSKVNRDQKNKWAKRWNDNNRPYRRLLGEHWRVHNQAKATARQAKREAAKAQRTPAWADFAAIRAFYEACPAGMEVDHVVPLRGKLVSGLHVLNNLQYLTPEQNQVKGNKFEQQG